MQQIRQNPKVPFIGFHKKIRHQANQNRISICTNYSLSRRNAFDWQGCKDRTSKTQHLTPLNHRSHSPNTTSMAPRMAVASGSMWPLHMKSIA